MTSKEWAQLHPTRWKRQQQKYRDAHKNLCKGCGGVRERRGSRYCNLCKETVQKQVQHSRTLRFRQKVHRLFTQHKVQQGCSKCGYNRCGAALDYHHITGKERRITAPLWYSHSDLCQDELKKCTLICKNCHYEIHQKEKENGTI